MSIYSWETYRKVQAQESIIEGKKAVMELAAMITSPPGAITEAKDANTMDLDSKTTQSTADEQLESTADEQLESTADEQLESTTNLEDASTVKNGTTRVNKRNKNITTSVGNTTSGENTTGERISSNSSLPDDETVDKDKEITCKACLALAKEHKQFKAQTYGNLRIFKEKILGTSELVAEFHQKSQDLEQCREKLKKITARLDSCYGETGILRIQLDKALQANEPLKKTLKRFENEKFLLNTEMETLKGQLKASQANMSSLKDAILSSQVSNDDLKRKTEENDKEMNKEKKKVLNQASLIDKLNAKLKEARDASKASKKELKVILKENEKLQKKLEKALQRLDSKKAKGRKVNSNDASIPESLQSPPSSPSSAVLPVPGRPSKEKKVVKKKRNRREKTNTPVPFMEKRDIKRNEWMDELKAIECSNSSGESGDEDIYNELRKTLMESLKDKTISPSKFNMVGYMSPPLSPIPPSPIPVKSVMKKKSCVRPPSSLALQLSDNEMDDSDTDGEPNANGNSSDENLDPVDPVGDPDDDPDPVDPNVTLDSVDPVNDPEMNVDPDNGGDERLCDPNPDLDSDTNDNDPLFDDYGVDDNAANENAVITDQESNDNHFQNRVKINQSTKVRIADETNDERKKQDGIVSTLLTDISNKIEISVAYKNSRIANMANGNANVNNNANNNNNDDEKDGDKSDEEIQSISCNIITENNNTNDKDDTSNNNSERKQFSSEPAKNNSNNSIHGNVENPSKITMNTGFCDANNDRFDETRNENISEIANVVPTDKNTFPRKNTESNAQAETVNDVTDCDSEVITSLSNRKRKIDIVEDSSNKEVKRTHNEDVKQNNEKVGVDREVSEVTTDTSCVLQDTPTENTLTVINTTPIVDLPRVNKEDFPLIADNVPPKSPAPSLNSSKQHSSTDSHAIHTPTTDEKIVEEILNETLTKTVMILETNDSGISSKESNDNRIQLVSTATDSKINTQLKRKGFQRSISSDTPLKRTRTSPKLPVNLTPEIPPFIHPTNELDSSVDEVDSEVASLDLPVTPHPKILANSSSNIITPTQEISETVADTSKSPPTVAPTDQLKPSGGGASNLLTDSSNESNHRDPSPENSEEAQPLVRKAVVARRHSMFVSRETWIPASRRDRSRSYSPRLLSPPSPPLSPMPPSPRRNVLTPMISPLPTTPLPDSLSPLPPSPKITSPPLIRGSALIHSENNSVRIPVPLSHRRSGAIQAINFTKQRSGVVVNMAKPNNTIGEEGSFEKPPSKVENVASNKRKQAMNSGLLAQNKFERIPAKSTSQSGIFVKPNQMQFSSSVPPEIPVTADTAKRNKKTLNKNPKSNLNNTAPMRNCMSETTDEEDTLSIMEDRGNNGEKKLEKKLSDKLPPNPVTRSSASKKVESMMLKPAKIPNYSKQIKNVSSSDVSDQSFKISQKTNATSTVPPLHREENKIVESMVKGTSDKIGINLPNSKQHKGLSKSQSSKSSQKANATSTVPPLRRVANKIIENTAKKIDETKHNIKQHIEGTSMLQPSKVSRKANVASTLPPVYRVSGTDNVEDKLSISIQQNQGFPILQDRHLTQNEDSYVKSLVARLLSRKVSKLQVVEKLLDGKNISTPSPLINTFIHISKQCTELLIPQVLQKLQRSNGQSQIKLKEDEDLNITLRKNQFFICHPTLKSLKTPVLTGDEGILMAVLKDLKEHAPFRKNLHVMLKILMDTIWMEKQFLACEILSVCRLYASICRLYNSLDSLVMFLYNIAFDRPLQLNFTNIFITCYTVWPAVLSRQDLLTSENPLSLYRVKLSPLSTCFKMLAFCDASPNGSDSHSVNVQVLEHLFNVQWKDHYSTYDRLGLLENLLNEFYSLLKNKELSHLENESLQNLNDFSFSCMKAMQLICVYIGWEWTYNHVIVQRIWHDLKNLISKEEPLDSDTILEASILLRLIGELVHCGIGCGFYEFQNLAKFVTAFLWNGKGLNSLQCSAASTLLVISPTQPDMSKSVLFEWKEYWKKHDVTIPKSIETSIDSL